MAVIPTLLRKPRLIWAVFIRNRCLSAEQMGEGFIAGSGKRISYWAWLPNYPAKGRSTWLLKELLRYMTNLGVNELLLEVDRVNRKTEVVHRLLGAKIVNEFTTRDGRERIVMKYELDPS